MKTKLVLAAIGLGVVAGAVAQYTVPKVWTRTKQESVVSATQIFDANTTNTATTLRFRYKVVSQSDPVIVEYSQQKIANLPDLVTNTISGIVS